MQVALCGPSRMYGSFSSGHPLRHSPSRALKPSGQTATQTAPSSSSSMRGRNTSDEHSSTHLSTLRTCLHVTHAVRAAHPVTCDATHAVLATLSTAVAFLIESVRAECGALETFDGVGHAIAVAESGHVGALLAFVLARVALHVLLEVAVAKDERPFAACVAHGAFRLTLESELAHGALRHAHAVVVLGATRFAPRGSCCLAPCVLPALGVAL